MTRGQARAHSVLTVAVIVVVWEVVGRLQVVAHGALPSLSAIGRQLWADRSAYPRHVGGTVRNAALGLGFGTIVGLALAVAFALLPMAERLLRGVTMSLAMVPPIVVAPVLAVCFGGEVPKVVLAALGVFFPITFSTLLAMRSVDQAMLEIPNVAGGTAWASLRYVQLPSALPGFLAGLRIAAPAAMLGAILGEFMGGRWGIGVFLIGSLGQGLPARLWGIALVSTLIAAGAYQAFALVGVRSTVARAAVTISPTSVARRPAARRRVGRGRSARLVTAVVTVAVTLVAWQLFITLLHLPPTFARGPLDTFHYLFSLPSAADNRSRLLHALATTLPKVGLGMATGLALAFALAVGLSLTPRLARAVVPFALVSQSMPLVAFAPLAALIFGRQLPVTVVITAVVTFFPSFVTIAQGLAGVAPAGQELFRTFDASAVSVLWRFSIPSALQYVFAAATLAAPRALMGVMIAEYLITGDGLGYLLAASRGRLEFGMMWAIAAVVVVLSVALFQLMSMLEALRVRRFAPVPEPA